MQIVQCDRATPLERFVAKVKFEECWLWTAGISDRGYAYLGVGREAATPITAGRKWQPDGNRYSL